MRKIMDVRVDDKIRNEELRRRSELEGATTAVHLKGGGKDTRPERIKKDGLSPQEFGTRELAEETEGGQDTGGRKR